MGVQLKNLRFTTLYTWIVVFSLALGTVLSLNILQKYQTKSTEFLLYLPSGKNLKPIALGYNQMLADLLWIKTVSYFGSHFMTDKEYPWLFHILTLIIDLDPRFDFPYYFGGIVLSLEGSQAENANKILEKGIEAYPNKWEYPFYIGFNLYYHLGDPLKAAPYIEQASLLPGAPQFTKTLAGTLYEKSGKNNAALEFYRGVYNNTANEIVREKVANRIKDLVAKREKDDARN